MNYQATLKAAKKKGTANCNDNELLALWLQNIQFLCGAVSHELVYQGAIKKGLTYREVKKLANENPQAIEDLMWV